MLHISHLSIEFCTFPSNNIPIIAKAVSEFDKGMHDSINSRPRIKLNIQCSSKKTAVHTAGSMIDDLEKKVEVLSPSGNRTKNKGMPHPSFAIYTQVLCSLLIPINYSIDHV